MPFQKYAECLNLGLASTQNNHEHPSIWGRKYNTNMIMQNKNRNAAGWSVSYRMDNSTQFYVLT